MIRKIWIPQKAGDSAEKETPGNECMTKTQNVGKPGVFGKKFIKIPEKSLKLPEKRLDFFVYC